MKLMKYLALSAMLLVAGCAGSAGNAARERALLPALRSTWPAVGADVLRGIQDGVHDGDLNQESGDGLIASSHRLGDSLDRTIVVAKEVTELEWPILHPWANRGVIDRQEHGEIGPGVAKSFEERIKNFNEDLHALWRMK